jgi:uncharacterized protein
MSDQPGTAPAPTVNVPPGWYPDGYTQRWWDGAQWGPQAPMQFQAAPQVDSNDKSLAMLAHLGMLVGGFILPLILYLISADQTRPLTREHAREALNFQITFLIVWIVGFIVMFSTLSFSIGTDSPPIPFFIIFPLMFILFFIAIALSIVGAVKASQGKSWRYPVALRLIKK